MKKTTVFSAILSLVLMSAFACLPAEAAAVMQQATETRDSSIMVASARVIPHERSMIVSMSVRVNRHIRSTESLELRPILTDGGSNRVELPSIFINGRAQNIIFHRNRSNARRDCYAVHRTNGVEQTVDYLREVGYRPWMRSATLMLEEVPCGCGIPVAYDSYAVATCRSDATPRLAFLIPAVEDVKVRQESGRAYLSFPVNKTEIQENYRGNAAELKKIMAAIDLVKNDSNVMINHISIHGYASPDGSYARNEQLALGRTLSLKQFVMSKYTFDERIFTTSHTAEDWEGLVSLLRKETAMENRDNILKIATGMESPDAREQRIRAEYPAQYRYMVDNWYPKLRHSDYTVGYIVRPFTVEEAKREFRVHPQNLSIDEMFRIAQTYKEGSEQYNEVFLTAVKQNPEHPVANLNAACIALKAGDTASAERYLEKAAHGPERTLAYGVLMMKQGKTEDAERLFKEAYDGGLKEEATHNLRILHPEAY